MNMETETPDALHLLAETPVLQTSLTPAALAQQRLKALARWDSEGGAGPAGPQAQQEQGNTENDAASATLSEFAQLHARVIALENLLIAVLAEGSERQVALATEMAGHISPRPESTRHPLTIHAASLMLSLIERSSHLAAPRTETGTPSAPPKSISR